MRDVIDNPSLADILIEHKRDIFLSLNCHAIATIKEFNAAKQTVKATIAYRKLIAISEKGVPKEKLEPYPTLVDCPVIVLGGGGFHLTFPIKEGDKCLILFNDRDMDNWIAGSFDSAPPTDRAHSFADGIALVGLNKVADFDTTRASLSHGGGGKVEVTNTDLINIANDAETLKALMQDLISAVNDLVTATAAITVLSAAPGNATTAPVNVLAIQAVALTLSGISTRVGALLE